MHEGFAIRRAAGAHLVHSSFYPVLAESHINAKELGAAEELLKLGFEHIEKSGERRAEAELHRVQAQLQSRRSLGIGAASASLQRAIEIARLENGKLFELRASRDLARLLSADGNRKGALDLLTPIYSWFVEGLETEDVKEAKILLEELRCG
jgi:predicted ATPase